MNMTADNRRPPALWPFLLLSAAVAVWIDLGTVHRSQYADSLLPVQISLQKWTPYFWEQDRIGMLLPLVAKPIKHPLANLLVQTGLNLFAGMASLFLLARYVLRDASYPVVAILGLAAFLGLTPAYYRFEFLVNTCDGLWLALGLGGLILLEPKGGRIAWRRRVMALVLFALAHWVYLTATLYLAPLVLCRGLFLGWGTATTASEGPDGSGPLLRWARCWIKGETVAALALLAAACAGGFLLRALVSEGVTRFGGLPVRDWPVTLYRMLANTWINLAPQLWPLTLAVLGIAGGLLLLLPSLRRHAGTPLRGALAVAAAAAGIALFTATRQWVPANLYMFRYLLVSCFYLQAAVCIVAAAPLAAALGPRLRHALAVLTVAALVAAVGQTYGRPSLRGVRRDLAVQHVSTCTSIDPLDGMSPEEILDARCTHVAGDYYKVWPAVFLANLTLRERGEPGAIWGVTLRSQPTAGKWQRIPREAVRVAIPAGGDAAADFFLHHYNFPALEVTERRATIWVLRPAAAGGAAQSGESSFRATAAAP
jgi:hypothetical protein